MCGSGGMRQPVYTGHSVFLVETGVVEVIVTYDVQGNGGMKMAEKYTYDGKAIRLTKDERVVEHTALRTFGCTNLLSFDRSSTETSEFPVRLDEVRVFQIRTRPVRSIEFKNVPLLPSAKPPEAGDRDH